MHDSPNLTATPGDTVAPARRGISRRAVVGTAAWVAPTIVVATAVPAFAASGDSLVRVTPSAATFTADQASTSETLTATLTNNGVPVEGRVLTASITATSGASTDWLSLSQSTVATGADGGATFTLLYGAPKPATGSTYLISVVDPADPSLQVSWTLTYSPVPVTAFSTDFNGIGGGLPSGLLVVTGARNAFPGTTGTFTSTKTAWSNTGAGFFNVASATATGLGQGSTSTQQDAATDRALGLLATGTAEQNGIGLTIALGPTTGRTNVTVSLKAQQVGTPVATDPRIATWTIDAGVGTTKLATATPTFQVSRGAFGSTVVNASFGNALDNLSGNVVIRIAVLALTTGSGNRPFTAFDDLTVSWT